jgi:hypothetical protein
MGGLQEGRGDAAAGGKQRQQLHPQEQEGEEVDPAGDACL